MTEDWKLVMSLPSDHGSSISDRKSKDSLIVTETADADTGIGDS